VTLRAATARRLAAAFEPRAAEIGGFFLDPPISVRMALDRISQIIGGKRSISGDTALRLGRWFGVDPQFWLNLQAQFDLAIADRQTGDAIRHLPTRGSLPARPESARPA
jgi:hypothetical protein